MLNRLAPTQLRPVSGSVRSVANARPSRRNVVVAKNMMGGMSPAALEAAMKDPKMREAMQEAMKNPAFMEQMKKMQEAMAKPEVQQQMAEMQSFMQNQQLQQRMQVLKNDPEFAEIFADIQKNGTAALMKYYNDPAFLKKLGDKIGDVVPSSTAQAAAGIAQAAPPAVEINNMLDAAKYGDLEAVEDYIAIGKDVNMKDADARTPLHYACAYAHGEIARLLLESGAEVEALDIKGNTPLHYAAGYGRPGLTRMMIDAGANRGAKNGNGKTAAELVAQAPQNPINSEADLLQKLQS